MIDSTDGHIREFAILAQHAHSLVGVEPLSVVTIQEGAQTTLRETIKVTVPNLHETTQQFTTITQTIPLTLP